MRRSRAGCIAQPSPLGQRQRLPLLQVELDAGQVEIAAHRLRHPLQRLLFRLGLIHPRINLYCKAAADAGFHLHLSSNLNFLKDEKSLLTAGVKTIRISLSGFTQSIYEQGHRGGNIEKVKANMRRLSAARAYEIGMVSEVVPSDQLLSAAEWCATRIAAQPKLAIEGTVRAIWGAREFGSRAAVHLGYAYVSMGTSQDSIAAGQKVFESGERIEWRAR